REPLAHRAGRDFTDFRDLTGGKHFLHGRHSSSCIAESPPRPADAGARLGSVSARSDAPRWGVKGDARPRAGRVRLGKRGVGRISVGSPRRGGGGGRPNTGGAGQRDRQATRRTEPPAGGSGSGGGGVCLPPRLEM